MQGIELSRRFYAQIIAPWLDDLAPGLPHAAALIGYGSELLGFDDETSKDHNWGPRVHLYLERALFEQHAKHLVTAFSSIAPQEFLGEPIGWRSRPNAPPDGDGQIGVVGHGLEIHTLEARLHEHFALETLDELTSVRWLGFAEQKLLAFTAGAVFRDDDGRLTAARERMAYFPRDVWLFRLACQWRRIAEEQAFVGRAGEVGDDLGSRVVAARLVRDVMRMGFLLEGRYAPYSKWLGTAFAHLPIAAVLTPLLERALRADGWRARGEALAQSYLELARRQNAMGLGAFEPLIGPYHDRPFVTINADMAVKAARPAITDPGLRALSIIGAIDQISDSTPVLDDAGLSSRIAQVSTGR